MEIVKIENKEQWNSFVLKAAGYDGGFLQSWEWGECQKEYSRKVFRMGAMENQTLLYGWQIIEMPLPFGLKYWYIPRPIFNFEIRISKFIQNSKFKIWEVFIEKIKTLAKKEGVIFIRIDGMDDILQKFGFRKVNISVQPREELLIDITRPEDELLHEMKPKTRYNIRLAQKHGVEARIMNYESPHHPAKAGGTGRAGIRNYEFEITEDFEKLYGLISETSNRQGIRPHPKNYYRILNEVLGKAEKAKLYFAEYQGSIIAGCMIVYSGKTATYLHGGSSDKHKEVMAPYLLHWKAITDAQKSGFQYYNFGGVSFTSKNWEGITRFKTGFSPHTEFMKYGGVWEMPVRNTWYRLYTLYYKFKN